MTVNQYAELTPLERELVSRFHNLYRESGVPSDEDVVVQERQQSSSLRRTQLRSATNIRLPETILYLGSLSHVQLDAVEAGLTVELEVIDRNHLCLCLLVNGNGRWDGSEDGWKIIDA